MERGTGGVVVESPQVYRHSRGTTTTSVRKRSRSSERKKVLSSPHSRHKRTHSRSRRKTVMRGSGATHVTKAVFGPPALGHNGHEENEQMKQRAALNQQQLTVPLKVLLPPLLGEKQDNCGKVLTMDEDRRKGSPDTDPNTTDNNVGTDLNVEEFECGVSVTGSDNEKQEWSFTLYDFDGRGKVTKEDLGRLLQSLYQAVGSSISLPDKGTKTMKLRLTVGPDSTKLESKKESNTTPKQENKLNKERDGSRSTKNGSIRFASVQNNLWQGDSQQAEKPLQHMDIKNNLSRTHSRSPAKGRGGLCLVDHKDLAELVQKNMERHHRQQKLRKHSSERVQTSASSPRQPANNRNVALNVESPERRNYYLDLAGVENQGPEPQSGYTAQQLQYKSSPLMKMRSKSHTHRHQCSKSHGVTFDNPDQKGHRSRSHDGHITHEIEHHVTEELVQVLNSTFDASELPRRLASRSRSAQQSPVKSPRPQHKTSTPKTVPRTHTPRHRPSSAQASDTVSSPHYHRRHRHREKNHDRAMKQVAEWIEREHALNCGTTEIVQRHEHHHIHEHHHHHHYHHYQET